MRKSHWTFAKSGRMCEGEHLQIPVRYLGPVQGQPFGGAAVVTAGLSERGPSGGAGRIVQHLLLRRRNPPFTQYVSRSQAAVTAATALGPVSCPPAEDTQHTDLLWTVKTMDLGKVVQTEHTFTGLSHFMSSK